MASSAHWDEHTDKEGFIFIYLKSIHSVIPESTASLSQAKTHLFVCILHVSNFPSWNEMDLDKRTIATADTEGEN